MNNNDLESMKQFLNLFQTEQGKMIIALSCDENTLENIEEIDKQIDDLDTKIYNILVGYFGGNNLYNNFSSLSNIFSGNDEYQTSFSGLINVVNGLKFLGNVSGLNDKYNLKDMISVVETSNMMKLKLVLVERKKLECEKKSLLNECIKQYEKQMQSKESQDLMKIISDSMENSLKKRRY